MKTIFLLKSFNGKIALVKAECDRYGGPTDAAMKIFRSSLGEPVEFIVNTEQLDFEKIVNQL